MNTRIRHSTLLITACLATLGLIGLSSTSTTAASFQYTNITDLAGGPGAGAAPQINNSGDIAFYNGSTIYFYDRSAGTFLNLMSLSGAPADGWFPRVNGSGNIVFINPFTRELWFFEAGTQAFTNLASVSGYPGNTGSNDLNPIFDINDDNRISFHSGDNNNGDVWVYRHATGAFNKITDQPGGPTRGRENRINNFGQVAYNGFPDTYVWDPSDSTTTNVTDLPGGPGSGFSGFSLNDLGDIAIYRGDEITVYDKSTGTFLYFSTLPGFPPGIASVTRNGLSDRGGVCFWRDEIFYFDPIDQSFTQLTNQGVVPFPGLESHINDSDEIAFVAGGDVWLAVPSPATAVGNAAPSQVVLRQNVPNPFNPSTTIEYVVTNGGTDVRLEVYDVSGRLVRTLFDGIRSAGNWSEIWDGRDTTGAVVSSGVYFYRLTAGTVVQTRKMHMVK